MLGSFSPSSSALQQGGFASSFAEPASLMRPLFTTRDIHTSRWIWQSLWAFMGENYDACDRQLSRNVVPTYAEYLAHHRRPAVPGARDVEIFELASFALDGSGPHIALRHQRHD